MIRTLLATTALAGVLATGAFAQESTTPAPGAPAATAPADTMAPADATAPADAMAPADGATTDGAAAAIDGEYLQTLGTDQYLASDLTGGTLYQSDAADAEAAGEIDNFLVGSDGQVVAAIVDTGSFLDEAKVVAIPFEKITWATGEDNEPRAVLTATREELMSAPAFTETTAAEAAAGGVAAPAATDTSTTATAPAATDTSTMAAAPAATDTPAAATPTDPAASTDTAATAPAVGETEAMETVDMASGEFAATVGADQYLSQDLIGGGVFGGPADDAESIGSINDIVMSGTGEVAAAIIGVGGFLGIGEKDVGVPFAELQLTKEDGAEPRIVLAATKEQLTDAPTFDDDGDAVAGAGATGGETADTTMASEGAAAGATAGAAVGSAADATSEAAGDTADATTSAANNAATGTGNALESADTAIENAGDDAATTAAGATAGAAATADTATTASTGGATDRASLTPVTGPELTAESLEGTTVYGPNDVSIGDVGDIALSADGQVDAIIVDVGGFLGIGEKQVAVAMDNLEFMKDAGGSMYLYTQFTQEQLESAPAYDSATYTQNRETMRINAGEAPATAQ